MPIGQYLHKTVPIEKRFWKKIDIKDSIECWEWKAVKNNKNYGQVSFNGKMELAHRVMWILVNGEIPDNLCVLHKCDNPSCVNPSHLFLGTKRDNSNDMVAKGRRIYIAYRGIDNGSAVLTEEDVLKIRELHHSGISQHKIAKIYGRGVSTIHHIVKRQTWKHI